MFQGWRCTQLQWESWICDIASMLKDLSVFRCQLSPKGDFWINFLALVMHSSCYFSLGSDSFIIHSTFNAIASAGLMWCWWSENFYFYPEFPHFTSLTLHQQIIKEHNPSFDFTFIPSQKQSVFAAPPAKLCPTQSQIHFEILSL